MVVYLSVLLVVLFAVLWYRAGAALPTFGGRRPGLLWCGLSVLASIFVLFVIRGGLAALLFVQMLLLLGIGGYLALRGKSS